MKVGARPAFGFRSLPRIHPVFLATVPLKKAKKAFSLLVRNELPQASCYGSGNRGVSINPGLSIGENSGRAGKATRPDEP